MGPLDPIIVAAVVGMLASLGGALLTGRNEQHGRLVAPYKDLADRVHDLEASRGELDDELRELSKRVRTLQRALDEWTQWWERLSRDWPRIRSHDRPPAPPSPHGAHEDRP